MSSELDLIIIGGGASGIFAAIAAAEHNSSLKILVLENNNKLLAKVKISGGGRCNVTNAVSNPEDLVHYYPRGGKKLKGIFYEFGPKDTFKWFENRGVPLKTEADGRVFPISNQSQSIIDCLLSQAAYLNIVIKTEAGVHSIEKIAEGFLVNMFGGGEFQTQRIIEASGGHPKTESFQRILNLGHQINTPIPSLFTFNMPKNPICNLLGVQVEKAIVRIEKTKYQFTGPLLITHWGMSGPAVLKLSAFAALDLAKMNYQFGISVNWTGNKNQIDVMETLQHFLDENSKKQIARFNPFGMPKRLWEFLLEKVGIKADLLGGDLKGKSLNRLIELLMNDHYDVNGKTTFKEEFVTAGGIRLDEINLSTMESKIVPGLYFAGEICDIDGITGGFNFQAAWSTGFLAGKNAALSLILP